MTELWSSPKRLQTLALFFEREAQGGASVSDEQFVKYLRETYWPTNAWSFVEQSIAIGAHACALRPHLARNVFREPIRAMVVARGVETPEEAAAAVRAALDVQKAYVPLSLEGRAWLADSWPTLAPMLHELASEELNCL